MRFQPLDKSSRYASNTNYQTSFIEDRELDWDAFTVKGTSQELEKQYLRLTSAPDPSTVRPETILKKSFQMLKDKWIKSPDYLYTCEQLKSVRQDLTVQRIKNEFTVEVYEYHARLALENNDLGEFNQCQSQLKALYLENISGNKMEFLAYRLLYFVHQNNFSDITAFLAELSQDEAADSAVLHALQVREAIALSNYHKLFKLYQTVPNKGIYLMNLFIPTQRISALQVITKAYKPTNVPISWIQSELVCTDDDEDSFVKFLQEHGAITCKDDTELLLDTKQTVNIT